MIHLHGTQAVAFRVLIADDDAIQRLIVARCVEMLGWQADLAATVDEAAALFAARAHHIVLIDLNLGARGGITLLRRLRRDRADPVVIFVSGAGDRTRAAAFRVASDLGLRVAGTLAKPIDPYRLHALLLSNPTRLADGTGPADPIPTAEELDHALRHGEIHTEYQPKIDLTTGEIVGVEALARWDRPGHGPVPPDRFVALAEQSDLIKPLTFAILREAAAACRRWRAVRPNCSVAVNIFPRLLTDRELLPEIESVLVENCLPPSSLVAEITESAMISHLPAATEVLTHLSLQGVRISMDDFGTGYSSLLSLLRMPFTELKIDRSFVSVCGTDRDAWKIVRASVSLARELGMRVVAEGIETLDISERLRDVGCDMGQGWFFGRPMTESALMRRFAPSANRLETRAEPILAD